MPHRLTRSFPLVLSFATATGCIPFSSGGQEDDSRSGFHDVTVNWSLRNVDGSLMTSCPPGFTTMYANLYRNPGGLVAPPDAELILPCTPQGSFTQPVATGGELKDPSGSGGFFDYTPEKDILLAVTEETLSEYAAETSLYYIEALTSDLTLDFDIYPDGGVGVIAWQFESTLTSAPIPSCAAAGVDQIEAAIRPFFDEQAPLVVVGTWGCSDVDPYQYYEPNGNGFALIDDQFELGSGTTRGIAPGEYFAEVRAKRAGVVVGTTVEGQVIIDGENDANPITPAVIPINDR